MPFFSKRNGISSADYSIEKFSLYNSVLSALEWRKNNGRIFLCTDPIGAAYYRKLGIERVWDEVREVIPPDQEGIDPNMFWAAGKLLAMRETSGDYALLDEDFIVWKTLSLPKTAVTAVYIE